MEASTTDTSRLITVKIALYPKGDTLATLQVDPDTPAAAFKALAEEHLRAEADVAEWVDDDTDRPPTEEVVGNKRARSYKPPVDAAIASAMAQCEQIAHLLQPTSRARRPPCASFVITQWYVAVGLMTFRELPMIRDDNDKEKSIKDLGIADGTALFVALLLAEPKTVGGALQLLLRQQKSLLRLLQEIKDSDRSVAEARESLSLWKESPLYVLQQVLENKSYRGTAAAMAVIHDSACGINRVSQRGWLEEWDVGDGTDRGWTPIMVAIHVGRMDVVKELIECGADLMITSDCCYFTPLHLAVVRRNIEAIKMIAPRMNLKAVDLLTDYQNYTPLHVAIDYYIPEAIKLLIAYGSNVDGASKNSSTGTPLHLAVERGQEDTVRILIENGANVQATTKKRVTPLQMSCIGCIDDMLQDAGAVV